MSLSQYKTKRNFRNTPEPGAKEASASTRKLTFVVQRHQASHLHYDFRLEMEGVLKSWAVPKGPSLNPADKRLAMMVEDHPYDYRTFEGTIPEGNYGAGVVEIWDSGTYEHIEIKDRKAGEKQLLADLKKGSIKIVLKGKKLKGEFALVKLKGNNRGANSWLLIKHKDEYAVSTPYNSEEHTAANSAVTKEVKRRAAAKTAKKKAQPEQEIKPEVKSKRSLKTVLNELASQKKYTTYISPMLAKAGDKPFSDQDWIFEVKWDGYRAVAEAGNKNVKLYSRNGLSFETKYPEVAAELSKIKTPMVLDGEIVVLDKDARPDFQLLQHYPDIPEDAGIAYYVFDLLSYKGKDLRQMPLLERKALLKKIFPKSPVIRYCEHVEEDGKAFFEWAKKKNLEGIIAKKTDSLYYSGKRSSEWLKIRNHTIQETVIAGYTAPRGSRNHFGALILGVYKGDKLTYVGHTGTGFDEKSLSDLYASLASLVITKSPFEEKIKTNAPVTWVKPVLVCNIKFTEWTEDGNMRHPVFMGLRIDKKAKEVQKNNDTMATVTSVPKKTATATTTKRRVVSDKKFSAEDNSVKVSGKTVKLTNQDKIYFPEDKLTKGDVVKYYQEIYEYIIPYLKDRPESLKRNPNGIHDAGFFHKDAGDSAPEWVKSIPLFSESANKEIDYLICNDRPTLMYMNNLGCIEINPWNSRTGKLEYPDYMVIDIDPSDKNTFDQVIETALVVKKILDQAGAVSYCKTSGATGLHVYVPMGAKYTYDQVKDFAHIIATLVQEQLPEFTTLERSLSKRKNRIYIDYLQNRQGQTLSSVYSLRPKVGATVSTPLEWKEVKKGLHPSSFTIHTIFKRLKSKGDLFKEVLGKGINMSACLKKLNTGK